MNIVNEIRKRMDDRESEQGFPFINRESIEEILKEVEDKYEEHTPRL